MNRPLAGKTALVTGASSGLGEGIALRLAQEGAALCIHGRDETDLLAAARDRIVAATGATVHAVLGSLSDDAGADAVWAEAAGALGHVDILVNCAGGESSAFGTGGGWFDVDPDTWNRVYNSNLTSMVRLIRHAVPGMKERGWGRLIQLSSEAASIPMATIPDYQAAKLAIRSLTRSVAKALARTGITANSVSPCFTRSGGVDRTLKRMAAERGWGDDWAEIEAHVNAEMMTNHAGRIGQPADIAHAVAFLADPRADFVNGIDIAVDGGRG